MVERLESITLKANGVRLNMSIKMALRKFGATADASIRNKIDILIEKRVMEPVGREKLLDCFMSPLVSAITPFLLNCRSHFGLMLKKPTVSYMYASPVHFNENPNKHRKRYLRVSAFIDSLY